MPAIRKCAHDGPRFPSNGACKQCQIARRKARRQEYPEKVNAYNRARHAEDPERANDYGRKYKKSATFAAWYVRNRHREIWKKAKQRAAKCGREFTISVEDVERLLLASSECPYTRVPYEVAPGRNPWAPSLDRVDSKGGYTLDNVEITSLWWNLAKNSWSAEIVARAVAGLRTAQDVPTVDRGSSPASVR